MATQEEMGVLKEFAAALAAVDLRTAMSKLHPDVVIHEPRGLPYGGDWAGLEGVGKLFTTIGKAYEVEILESESFDLPGRAMLSMEVRFRSRRSGVSAQVPLIEFYRFKDQLISDVVVFPQDTHTIAKLHDQT